MVSKQIMFLHTCTVVKVWGARTVLQWDKVCRRWRRLNLQTTMFTSNIQYFNVKEYFASWLNLKLM